MEFDIVRSWNSYLDLFPEEKKDVYFTESYVKLYENDENEAVCLVCKEGDFVLLFPLLRRKFIYKGSVYYDFETAYGYGGPLFNTDNLSFRERALLLCGSYCERNGFVAGFVRFHPLLNNQVMYEAIGDVIYDRQTVAMDLTLSEAGIWSREIRSQNRNIIKKGIKNGLCFTADNDFLYLDTFIQLYDATMRRLSADDSYFFDRTYYDNFSGTIKNSFLGVVSLDGYVIAAAIFFYSYAYGHYHLAGSDPDYLSLSPNNFMIYQAALELKSRGVSAFHLGGGTSSDPGDTLLRFKGHFSPRRNQFMIGKTIFNRQIYSELCDEWARLYPDKVTKYGNFLLKYKY